MAVVVLGSLQSRKSVSTVRPNLNSISEESTQTCIQKFSVRQPPECKMPPVCFVADGKEVVHALLE